MKKYALSERLFYFPVLYLCIYNFLTCYLKHSDLKTKCGGVDPFTGHIIFLLTLKAVFADFRILGNMIRSGKIEGKKHPQITSAPRGISLQCNTGAQSPSISRSCHAATELKV